MRGISLRLLALALVLAPGVARAQVDGASFEYRNERRFVGTGGAYEGWSDELLATGHYTVSVPADASAPVQLHGAYRWRYTSPETFESGHEDRTVPVDRDSRRYVAGTDLDEYDDTTTPLAVWAYVPTTLHEGDEIEILDDTFRVTSTSGTVFAAGTERPAIQLRTEGEDARHDAYGDFTTRYVDEYWFDRATGMFLRESRTEHDVGTTESQRATLDVQEEITVVDASYAPHVGPIPVDPLLAAPAPTRTSMLPLRWAVPMALAVGLLVFLLIRSLVRRRPPAMLRGRPLEARELRGSDPLPRWATDISISFQAFLPHFVDVARRTGNAVWTASLAGDVIGLGIDDAATGVPTIFAREPDVCELLRQKLKRQDFFSELRHGNLASVIDATSRTGQKLAASTAYNVLETYEVLELRSPGSPAYDIKVVSRLEDAEVQAAGALLTRVLGAPADTYLSAALAAGDIAYVARVDGAVVGIGLATVVGKEGRLHTLAVDPAHRNAGLGRELVRARIRAMAALGAERIVTEISAQNSASLELARGEGLTTVGAMYVETAREAPTTLPTTVRR